MTNSGISAPLCLNGELFSSITSVHRVASQVVSRLSRRNFNDDASWPLSRREGRRCLLMKALVDMTVNDSVNTKVVFRTSLSATEEFLERDKQCYFFREGGRREEVQNFMETVWWQFWGFLFSIYQKRNELLDDEGERKKRSRKSCQVSR